MASAFRGVLNTQAQPGPNYAPIAGGDGGGNGADFYDEYVVVAPSAANDTITFGPPKALALNDRILGVTIDWDILGAGTFIQLGDDGSANRYVAATDSSAAGQAKLVNGMLGYKLTQDRDLIAKITGAAATVGAKIRCTWKVLRS